MHLLIVEDEQIIAARLTRILGEILGKSISQLQVAATLGQAEAYIKDHAIDLVFLDLNLNGKNGFELLKKMVAAPFQTIIVSAHTERAIEAFEYGVLDFVGKPFDRERLNLSIERYFNRVRSSEQGARYLSIKGATGITLIELDEVVYFRGAGAYTELVLKDGRTLLHGKTLEKLLQLLPNSWKRVHKSYLANMEAVHQWHAYTGSKYELELKDGTRIPVGRSRYKELRAQWL